MPTPEQVKNALGAALSAAMLGVKRTAQQDPNASVTFWTAAAGPMVDYLSGSMASGAETGVYTGTKTISGSFFTTGGAQISRTLFVGNSAQISGSLYVKGGVRIGNAYTLPRVDGSPNYVLTTDGSGTVSWAPSGAGSETGVYIGTKTISGSLFVTGDIHSSRKITSTTSGSLFRSLTVLDDVTIGGLLSTQYNRIQHVGTPSASFDAATKGYVDTISGSIGYDLRTNYATKGYVPSASGWTRSADHVELTTSTDEITIGTSTEQGKVTITQTLDAAVSSSSMSPVTGNQLTLENPSDTVGAGAVISLKAGTTAPGRAFIAAPSLEPNFGRLEFWTQHPTGPVIGRRLILDAGGVKSSANVYIRAEGPDGDGTLYFYDGGSNTGAFLKWDDANSRFATSAQLRVSGVLTATSEIVGSELRSNSNIYVNYDGSDADSFLYFYDNSSTTGQYLKWDESSTRFELSNKLWIPGYTLIGPDADPISSFKHVFTAGQVNTNPGVTTVGGFLFNKVIGVPSGSSNIGGAGETFLTAVNGTVDSYLVGLEGSVILNNSSGSQSVLKQGAGVVGNYKINSGSFSVTNAYGIWGQAPTKNAGSTITTAIAGYFENPTSGVSNYSIYAAGRIHSNTKITAQSSVVAGAFSTVSGSLVTTGNVRIGNAYTLPRVDGSPTYVLTTDGAGTVTWQAAGSTGETGLYVGTKQISGSLYLQGSIVIDAPAALSKSSLSFHGTSATIKYENNLRRLVSTNNAVVSGSLVVKGSTAPLSGLTISGSRGLRFVNPGTGIGTGTYSLFPSKIFTNSLQTEKNFVAGSLHTTTSAYIGFADSGVTATTQALYFRSLGSNQGASITWIEPVRFDINQPVKVTGYFRNVGVTTVSGSIYTTGHLKIGSPTLGGRLLNHGTTQHSGSLFVKGGSTFTGNVNVTGAVVATSVVQGSALRSNTDVYVNFDGADGNSHLYFYEGGSNNARYLRWNDGSNLFEVNDAINISGNLWNQGTATVSGSAFVTGTSVVSALRINQTPTAGALTPDSYIVVNLNGTNYRIPCIAGS